MADTAEQRAPSPAEDPVVDTTLIDAALAMTPDERLRHNDRMIRTILLLRRGLQTPSANADER
jgi:hypothetical protein